MAKNTPGSYHRTTIYLTDEQWRWLSRLAAQARLDDLSLSGSDVIRLAVTRLQDQLVDKELRKALDRACPQQGRAISGTSATWPARRLDRTLL
jgi:hypothetical protein